MCVALIQLRNLLKSSDFEKFREIQKVVISRHGFGPIGRMKIESKIIN